MRYARELAVRSSAVGELLVDAGRVSPHPEQRCADAEMPSHGTVAHTLTNSLKQRFTRKKQRAGKAIRFFLVHGVVLVHHHVAVRRMEYMSRLVFEDDVRQFVCQRVIAAAKVWRAVQDDQDYALRRDGDRVPAVGIVHRQMIDDFLLQTRDVIGRPDEDPEMLREQERVEGRAPRKSEIAPVASGRVLAPCLEAAAQGCQGQPSFFRMSAIAACAVRIICAKC